MSSVLCSGALMALTFPLVVPFLSREEVLPGGQLSFLAWIALVPLLWAVEGKGPREAFKLGFLAGAVFFSLLLYWVNIAMTVFGGIPDYLSIPSLCLLVLYSALHWGWPLALTAYLTRSRAAGVALRPWVVLPCAWWVAEFVRNYLFTGFPWGNLGYAVHRQLTVIQIADLFGVYGVAFLVVLVNATIYEVVYQTLLKRPRARLLRAPLLVPLGVLVCTLGLACLYSWWRLGETPPAGEGSRPLKVALIQGNIEQGIKNRARLYRRQILEIYRRMTEEADREGADLIIWPEAAYPTHVSRRVKSFRMLGVAEGTLSAHMLVGGSTVEGRGRSRRLTNSAFALDPDLTVRGRYDKSHLVPFGEYVPLASILPVDKVVPAIGTFVPGEKLEPFRTAIGAYGMLICYEGIFPEISRAFSRAGAEFLVNITNDAWYGYSSAPYQHLGMYVLRAVENRLPVARAANTGVSAFIDAYGRITAHTPIFERTTLTGELRPRGDRTLYSYWGDLFAWICGIWIVGLIIYRRRYSGEGAKK